MLAGQKVYLGPLLQGDAPVLLAWQNNAALARHNGLYRPYDQAKFDDWFNGAGRDPSRVLFAIRRPADAHLLGYVQIVNIQAANRSAELGLMIGEATNWNKGFGQEAIRLALDFCWRELNLQRVSLAVIGDNPRAIAAYGRAGFVHEGLCRRAVFVDGAFRDITIMAALREETAAPAYVPSRCATTP